MLFTYLVCPTCESLFSPELKACPVCGSAVKTETERNVYRVLPHEVCSNCGNLVSKSADVCPFCEVPMNPQIKREIVEQPVELEIIDIAEESIGRNQPVLGRFRPFFHQTPIQIE